MKEDDKRKRKKLKEDHWFSVQLKPVGNMCNLRCRYCYAKPHLASGKIMSKEVLECVVKKCLQNSSFPTFSWHGGEPALVGYEFFRHTMGLIKKYRKPDQKVRNLIQTNATRITSRIAKLFNEYNFGVSVSLDGLKHIHGINRMFPRKDKNSFFLVMRGIKILREQEVAPSVICTVSKETLPFAAETLNFLISHGFKRIKYSPVFDSLEDEFSVTSDEWFKYLEIVFYKWFELGDSSIQIRDLDEVIVWLSKESLNLCSSDRTCLHWISINPKGEMYPCEYLRSRYYYGNITQIELSDVFSTHAFQEFKTIYEKVPTKCQRCEFFELCGNGCPATREKNGKISLDGVYAFCEERKKLFHEIRNVFNNALKGGDVQ